MSEFGRGQIEYYNKVESKTIRFLFVIILLYMLCMVPLAGRLPQYARFVILPLMMVYSHSNTIVRPQVDGNVLLLFAIAVIPSIVFSYYKNSATEKACTVALMFVACSMYLSSRGKLAVPALYRALLFFAYINVLTNLLRLSLGGEYYRGFYGNRNSAAASFVISFFALFGEYWKTRKKWNIAFVLLCAFMILRTQSRGGFAAMIIGLVGFLYYIHSEKNSFARYMFIGIMVVLVFWTPISRISVVQRFSNLGDTRNALWDYAFMVIRQNIWFGVGFSSSKFTNMLEGAEGYNFHNSYIAMMADVGLFGVFFFALMFLLLGHKIIGNYKYLPEQYRIEFVSLFSIVLAFFVLSYGEAYLIVAGSAFSFVFWCCLFAISRDLGYGKT